MKLILAALVAVACAAAQESPDKTVFRTGVSLVHVDTEAVSQEGRVVGGLTQRDFRVFDDNKEQPIVQFASEDESLDLILLFDISGSMNLVVQKVSSAAHQAFQSLRPGDRVSVMVFNTRSWVLSPFSDDLAHVERVIREDVLDSRFGGGTLIQEAVDDAARRFFDEKRSERRRAVLIVTDNMGQRTRRDEPVIEDFWEADALLSGLIVDNPAEVAMHGIGVIMNPARLAMEAGMTGIALKTGGDTIHASDPAGAFEAALRRIRARYSLYYSLPQAKPGTKREIRVELAPDAAKQYPKTKIKARSGYIVPNA